MSTTLADARSALLRLANQFPAPSTYATQLSVLSDYFDNQVPLNIENKNLLQRVAVLEAALTKVRAALPEDPAIVTLVTSARKGIDCSAWMGAGCACRACGVQVHA